MASVTYFEEVHFSLIVILLLFELKNHEGKEDNITQFPKDTTYVWKEGEWSNCSLSSTCGDGDMKRIVWCEDEYGRETQQRNCDPEKKLLEARKCFKPCRRHKHSVRWKTNKWQSCVVTNPTAQCKEQSGIMKRTVFCVQRKRLIGVKQELLDEEECSRFLSKPLTQKPCLVTCPQDCIVSDFGNWTKCDECSSFSRIRTRRILVAPTNGGKSCPRLIDTQRCAHTNECLRNTSPEYEFSIKLEKWSSCMPSTNQTGNTAKLPVVGYRTRNVSCVNGLGEVVHSSWCTTRSALSVPTVENCIVSKDCQLTEWSQWSLLSDGCVASNGKIFPETRARYRKISILSEGNGKPCPHLIEKRFVSENLPSCSSRYKWISSEWGDCILHEGSCGGGLQRRKAICIRTKDLIPVEESLCKETRSLEVEQCFVTCPIECLVSSWSQWGQCKPFSKIDLEGTFMGYRQRERKIIQSAIGREDDCSTLIEVDSCQEPVITTWRTGNWSDCLLSDVTQPCGEGIRKRNASCVTSAGAKEYSLCDTRFGSPPVITFCYIACPRDCVLTEWTEWTPCTTTCKSLLKSDVKTRKRNILANPGSGGKPCPDPHQLIETEPCGHDTCFGYLWEKGKWSLCRPIMNRRCGKGIQERSVTCVHGNEITVSDKKCAPIMKPASERACTVPCPVDCITTNFTEWTGCPEHCELGARQYRVRYILQFPSFGGIPCPENLEETRPCTFRDDLNCPKKLNTKMTSIRYRWNIAAWSECTLTQGLQCGEGYQIRKVSCIREDGKESLPHYCLSSQQEKLVASSRRCHVFCNQRCSLSEWSSWSTLEKNDCPATTVRTREATGGVCAQNILVERKSISGPPTLPTSEGHWSKCITNQDNKEIVIANGILFQGTCGTGWRYIRGNQVDGCRQIGLIRDMCLEDCPKSCQMSDWSEWSSCNVTCGQGYRQRQRSVLQSGNKLGRHCPSDDTEIQEAVCDEPCDQYQWIAGEWSECDILNAENVNCGTGIQRRFVSCKKLLEDEILQEVDEYLCDQFDKPNTETDCVIHCSDDCVVSTWNSWSMCSKPCNSSQSRQRNRIILRMPSPSDDLKCPSLLEEEPCLFGSNCFHHKPILGKWSSCVLPEGAVCGQGISARAFSCIRSNGRHVHPKYCQKAAILPLTKPCSVICSIDCEVSQWTDWNDEECKPCFENGERQRTRHILLQPSTRGQPCPADLAQKIPCPFKPCYYWNLTEWSKCNLQGAHCGHGFRTRKTNCKRFDGVETNIERCLKINMTKNIDGWLDTKWLELAYDVQEAESCHEPCPGDCLYTTWSEWSLCHRDCSSGHVVGYQTRSRAVIKQSKGAEKCPYPLWETKPCWGGPCVTYHWRLKDGVVLCLRSDGMVAHGGCSSIPRPCYPACNTKQSRCDNTVGECICLDGYYPVYNRSSIERGKDNSPRITNCIAANIMDHEYTKNQTATKEEIVLKYYPDDNEFSFWMYAMICVGSAFVIFVVVTIYLMCSQNPAVRGNEETRTVRMKSYAAR